jgi:transposase
MDRQTGNAAEFHESRSTLTNGSYSDLPPDQRLQWKSIAQGPLLAVRVAAQALRKSQSALGAHHRRLCSRMDKPKAITASAHKLARLSYFMLTRGHAFVEAGQDEYEERYRQRVVQNLTRRAHQLGFQLTPQGTSPA